MSFALVSLTQKLAQSGSLVLTLRVRPGAPKSVIKDQMEDGSLKADVAATAEGGKANDALLKLLADTFKVPLTNIKLLKGQRGRVKVVRIINSM